MNLCNEGHDEVCYDSRLCPACDIRDDLEKRIEALEEDISRLEREINEQ